MPYVITTKRPDERPSRVGYADDLRVVSRRAAGTPEEARVVLRPLVPRGVPNLALMPDALSPETLVLGPSPDGTVIEVAHVSYDDLIAEPLVRCPSSLGWGMISDPPRRKQIIAAYNDAWRET